MSNRSTLFLMMMVALLAWGGILLFTRFIPPTTVPAFTLVFLMLMVALTGTFAPLAYLIGQRILTGRLYRTTTHYALRQGFLLASCIVLNLILRTLHSWNIFTALVILAATVILEFVSLARK